MDKLCTHAVAPIRLPTNHAPLYAGLGLTWQEWEKQRTITSESLWWQHTKSMVRLCITGRDVVECGHHFALHDNCSRTSMMLVKRDHGKIHTWNLASSKSNKFRLQKHEKLTHAALFTLDEIYLWLRGQCVQCGAQMPMICARHAAVHCSVSVCKAWLAITSSCTGHTPLLTALFMDSATSDRRGGNVQAVRRHSLLYTYTLD